MIKKEPFSLKIDRGKKRVKIAHDGYGLEFFTMRNGFQWTGFRVDDELLVMMKNIIERYFATKETP